MTTSQDTVAGFVFHEGDRIKKAREERELSQAELAIASRVSRGTIQNYESGGRVKSSSRKLIAEALGVSEGWLETGVLPTTFDGPAEHRAQGPQAINGGYLPGSSSVAEMSGRARLRGNHTPRRDSRAA